MSTADPALNLLLAQLRHTEDRVLVIADEHLANLANPPAHAHLQYISNRVDVANTLQAHGARVDLTDFELDRYPANSFCRIVYRISKEKAVVHHIINGAPRLLTDTGELVLIGHKQEGLNSYSKHAAQRLGGSVSKQRDSGGYTAVSLGNSDHPGVALDDSDYTSLRQVVACAPDISLYSKPGIYGWQKLDRGSELMIKVLGAEIEANRLKLPGAALDLGCGYGYLSAMLAELGVGTLVATDNNIAAVHACAKNFAHLGIGGSVVADDCARTIDQRFDLVVCNPPFHQGFDTSHQLTEKFLHQARAHLLDTGSAWFVVNRFIDIESKARNVFSGVVEVHCEAGFKVLRLAR
jgi:16S rRNA (guanine1207-N2)-methyltransferase